MLEDKALQRRGNKFGMTGSVGVNVICHIGGAKRFAAHLHATLPGQIQHRETVQRRHLANGVCIIN